MRNEGASTSTAVEAAATDHPTVDQAERRSTLSLLIREMRPRQWSKNLILFAALIFSQNLLHPQLLLRTSLAFVVFCLLSGMVYTMNDLLDLEADRRHSNKKDRPLASGALSARTAIVWVVFVVGVSLTAAGFIGIRFLWISLGFLAFNLAYSLYLKNVVILDVVSISISFLIRAIAGVIALNTVGEHLTISPWLLVVTFFLSLFLGLCKRRHEFLSLKEAAAHRSTLAAYSEELLNQLINMTATATLIAYSIYTIWPDTVSRFGTDGLLYTIPIVVIGVTRYMFLVYRRNLGGDPSEILLTEKSLWVTVLAWFVLVALMVYGGRA